MKRIENNNKRLACWSLGGFVAGVLIHLLVSAIVNMESSIDWNGGEYYGDLVDGIPNGEGRFERDGNMYTGYWTNGTITSGRIETSKYVYDGELSGFKFNGYGVCKYKNGLSYWGYWKDDYKEGLGKMQDKEGTLSFGFFEKGVMKPINGKNYKVGDKVYGIDVSRHQGVIDWQDLYLSCSTSGEVNGKLDRTSKLVQPVLFAIAKSTEGSDIIDSRFESNYSEAKRCGIICGAYHFLSMMSSGKEQAGNFIKNTPLEKGDFPPVLDMEKVMVNGKLPSDQEFSKIIPIAKEWLSTVEKHYKVKPVIYTNMNVYRKFIKTDHDFDGYDLWLAFHDKESDNVSNCVMCQYSHKGEANGINDAKVDLNIFYGSYADLTEYCR